MFYTINSSPMLITKSVFKLYLFWVITKRVPSLYLYCELNVWFVWCFLIECIHLLLAHDAPVRLKNLQGWTPLAEAVSRGDRQTSKNLHSGQNFIKLLKHEICSLIKTGLPTKFVFVVYCLLPVFSCCLLVNPENHMEICFIVLFLSKKKFHTLANFCAEQLYEIGPRCFLLFPPGQAVGGFCSVWMNCTQVRLSLGILIYVVLKGISTG